MGNEEALNETNCFQISPEQKGAVLQERGNSTGLASGGTVHHITEGFATLCKDASGWDASQTLRTLSESRQIKKKK